MTKTKGFTLVELLIVIGILAVLATATVLVLNPAELLAQGRDTTRVSDMGTLVSALSLYLSDVNDPDMHHAGSGCKDQLTGGSSTSGNFGFSNGAAAPSTASFTGTTTAAAAATGNIASTVRLTDGTGWLPVNFNSMSTKAPFGALPIDPVSTGEFVYRYACDQTAKTFELNAVFQSTKYQVTQGLSSSDGGNKPASGACTVGQAASACAYEVGNDPGLDL